MVVKKAVRTWDAIGRNSLKLYHLFLWFVRVHWIQKPIHVKLVFVKREWNITNYKKEYLSWIQCKMVSAIWKFEIKHSMPKMMGMMARFIQRTIIEGREKTFTDGMFTSKLLQQCLQRFCKPMNSFCNGICIDTTVSQPYISTMRTECNSRGENHSVFNSLLE